MTTYYQALNPEGGILGTAIDDPSGLASYLADRVLSLDDHASYSVAVYKQSSVQHGKAYLVVQVSAEDFYKQYVAERGRVADFEKLAREAH